MRRNKDKERREALVEVRELLGKAADAFAKDPAVAHRFVAKARRAAMRVQLVLPIYLKRRYCKHCNHYLMPSVNARVRIQKSRVIIYCLDCKKYTRIPLH